MVRPSQTPHLGEKHAPQIKFCGALLILRRLASIPLVRPTIDALSGLGRAQDFHIDP